MAQGAKYIDDEIRNAATRSGAKDVAVVRYYQKPIGGDAGTGGEWFALFCDRVLWGRRRTKMELIDLARRGPLKGA